MNNNMNNIQADNQKCFDVVEKIKKYYIEDNLDIYSVVASYIFDVPYNDCILDTQSPKNIARRKFAKKLLLANNTFDEIYDKVCDEVLYDYASVICDLKDDLKKLIIERFPYSKDISYDYERSLDDKFTDSCTFIASILGYCRMCDYIHEHELSASENCENKETKSDLF